MTFQITIDFDLTPGDLELLKAIGERVKYSNMRAGCKTTNDTVIEPLSEAEAIKELLREALRANRAVFIPTVPMSKEHLAQPRVIEFRLPDGIYKSKWIRSDLRLVVDGGRVETVNAGDIHSHMPVTDLDSEEIDEGLHYTHTSTDDCKCRGCFHKDGE